MDLTKKEILEEIQEKREKMIQSANTTGFTSDDTIRYSQELDQLIYDYQRKCQKSEIKEEMTLYRKMLILLQSNYVEV